MHFFLRLPSSFCWDGNSSLLKAVHRKRLVFFLNMWVRTQGCDQ
uniref:Uncharacterized protein n=1 Tax=Arundo donax TaxID=35708 RepID=A0A0A9HI59_ARUDO